MPSRILAALRYLTIIAVICIIIASTSLLIYGGVVTFQVVTDSFSHEITAKGAKKMLLAFIELVDLFLLSTVLYIIAAGLYELFISDVDLPDWLVITDIDMLKDKLVGVVIVVLSVVFLGQALSWDGEKDLLNYGGAIAAVIATLTYFLSQKKDKKKKLPDADKEGKYPA
jgi:uncharacterized membrane protein YqhA